QPSLPPNASALAATAPQAGPGEPRKIRTVVIKPEPADPFAQGQSSSRVASNAAAFPTGTTPPATRHARPAPGPAAAARPAGEARLPLSPQGVAPSEPPRLKLASTATRPPVGGPTTAAAAAAAGGFMVQLAAQKTEEDAQTTSRALQAKFAGQLSGKQLVVR